MNQGHFLQEDQQSVCSFNSSDYCSLRSKTVSIDQNFQVFGIPLNLFTPSRKTSSIDEGITQKTISIQRPRIQIRTEKDVFQQELPFQLGFVMGKNKRNIVLDQDNIKRGKKFFDQQQTNFNQDLFPNHSLFQFPKLKQVQQFKEDIPQFSIPCFKNMGKKNKIQIDQNFLQKAKNFFNDDFEESYPSSFKKPTKVKKPLHEIGEDQNFIKTVNIHKNKKKQQINKIKIKQIFNWDKFFISSKKNLEKKEKSIRKSSKKKSSILNNKQKSQSNQIFAFILIKDLDADQLKNQQKLEQFKQRKQNLNSQIFRHKKSQCMIPKCLICDLQIEQNELNLTKLEQVFSNKLILEKIETQQFVRLYEQICFKLLKYDVFYPTIINKRLNPSNILVEMHKKSKVIQSGVSCLGWIEFCLKQIKFYHSFIAQIKQIYHNQKIKTYFIQLRDGWTNIWAIVTEKNYLYRFIHKLKICSKLFIGYWRVYPLANILSYCQFSEQNQKCIQIWYNSSIIVKQNLKLGKPKNLIFYRPLNLNRKQGGIIPTVEGTILRMFCPSFTKKKSFYSTSNQSFSQNFIEIITPQGFTVMIKYILPSDRCLAELFRLYYKYHFYFLKIGIKDSILQFNDDFSKFYQFEKKQKNSYDRQMLHVLKKRYINAMNPFQILNQLKIGNFYDIRLQGLQGIVNGIKFIVQNNNENQTTNSFLKGATYLYQQYQLYQIQRKSNQNNNKKQTKQFYLRKSKFSNTLKSLPIVYEKINQLT